MDLSGPGERPRYVAWAEAFGEDAPPATEGEPTNGPATDDEPEGPTAVAAAEPSDPVAAPSEPVVASSEPAAPSEPVVAANEPVAQPVAETPVPAAHRERDDTGRPVDLASTSAEARDAIRAHRESQVFEPLSLARDEDVDWSLPWW